MIALDTNVLVRYLVEDDRQQSARAAKLVDEAVESETPLYVSDIVLCETVWVLASAYRVPRAELASLLRRLLHAKALRFDAADVLLRALDAFEGGKGEFADYLIRESARAAGCEKVATFDRALLKEGGFIAP